MLRALELNPHETRLQQLLQRFRTEESSLTGVLQALQVELEHCHQETSLLRLIDDDAAETMLHRCHELQIAADGLANELVHVRMAVSGADEELAEHLGRRPHGRPAAWPARPIEMLA